MNTLRYNGYKLDTCCYIFPDCAYWCMFRPTWTLLGKRRIYYAISTNAQHVLWYPVQVWQSQKHTCFAMCSSVTRDACTCVRIDNVSTRCSIHTRDATAFVDVYKTNNTFLNMWKSIKVMSTHMFIYDIVGSVANTPVTPEAQYVPLRCLYGINRSNTAMIAVVPQWFRHWSPQHPGKLPNSRTFAVARRKL